MLLVELSYLEETLLNCVSVERVKYRDDNARARRALVQ